jgi:hypothetical protein
LGKALLTRSGVFLPPAGRAWLIWFKAELHLFSVYVSSQQEQSGEAIQTDSEVHLHLSTPLASAV